MERFRIWRCRWMSPYTELWGRLRRSGSAASFKMWGWSPSAQPAGCPGRLGVPTLNCGAGGDLFRRIFQDVGLSIAHIIAFGEAWSFVGIPH